MRAFAAGWVVLLSVVGSAGADTKFAVFYENDPQLDDPCKFLFVNIAGTVLQGGTNNYLEYPIGPFTSVAQAELARDRVMIELPPVDSNLAYSSRCRKTWSVDKDNVSGLLYMRNQLEVGSRADMQTVTRGLCGRDAAAMVRAANSNGPEPAYGFDVCLAPSAPGGVLRYTSKGWVTADGKPAKLPALAATKRSTSGWTKLGISDCTGQDTARSKGNEVPEAALCSKAKKGTVAVCWDGVRFKNGAERWCTYKDASAQSCKGGTAPGVIYECRE
jgi:hypothetical protein